MVQLATNNAYALIPGAVSSLDTSITLESGKGSLFPILGTGDYFYVTLVDVSGNYEIVKATARTGDILTVDRAQQGTLAIPFPANSRIELRVTAANIVSGGAGGAVDAADVTYTPSTLADWTDGIDPGQVDDALDELADRLTTVEATAGDSWPSAYADPVDWIGDVLPDNSGRAIDQLADRVQGLETLHPESIIVVCSDEATALTTGTAKVTFRMPFAMTVDQVKASLSTAQTSGSILTVDINEAGTSILSTKLTIDNNEKTSVTAATAAVISDSALAADAEITIDIDQVDAATIAKGLKVTITGTRT